MAFSLRSREQFQGLVDVIYGSATVNPATVAAGAEGTANVTIAGAALGDAVIPFPGVDMDALVWNAQVVSDNTVQINYANATGDHIDIASSTWRFIVLKPIGKFLGM